MYNQSDWIKQRMNFESIISKLNEILDFCNTFQIEYDQSKIASDSSSIDKILLNIRNGNDTCKKYKEKYIQINQNLKNIYSSTLNSNVDIADAKSDTDELMEICQRKLNSKFSNFDESIQNLNQQKVVIVMIEKIEHYIGVIKSHVQVVSRSFLKIGENIEKCKEFRNMNTENNVRINKLLEGK
ncbi:hypothetical protein A3Q56_07773 [Intoshia linei]|uniref:Uncharacterized protein n=1 Tax=Intoshia linei TaxID=1819745 RepID=A0A177ART3_9BILA|nr:hypothetical protein A3Q56_07773 [Intoshia linei]